MTASINDNSAAIRAAASPCRLRFVGWRDAAIAVEWVPAVLATILPARHEDSPLRGVAAVMLAVFEVFRALVPAGADRAATAAAADHPSAPYMAAPRRTRSAGHHA